MALLAPLTRAIPLSRVVMLSTTSRAIDPLARLGMINGAARNKPPTQHSFRRPYSSTSESEAKGADPNELEPVQIFVVGWVSGILTVTCGLAFLVERKRMKDLEEQKRGKELDRRFAEQKRDILSDTHKGS